VSTSQPTSSDRFKPKASREMACMFDDVSGRYDLLNALMTLGQDGAWREAMWRQVPATAGRVLDLCTGSGVSLAGLRRPGRTVLGVDVSLAMLRRAAEREAPGGWAPRLASADAFRLPLRAGSLGAVTVAFGMRNLRPRGEALAELARVLAPGGRLVVLEAVAPGRGPLAPFARAWIRNAIPILGRLSGDPSAYRYLAESIFEFGSGPEFEADLAAAGFRVLGSRSFLLGASRLWVAEPAGSVGQKAAEPAGSVQVARSGPGGNAPAGAEESAASRERSAWRLAQAFTSTALAAALVWAISVWLNLHRNLELSPPQRTGAWVLLLGGAIVFTARALLAWLAWSAARGGGLSRP
jgi:demethylmenaquinone methyltransferase/2-methoxy-6-polyprenyl-1,4-benzoquinol methylase